jgi:hypothetical protein
MYFVMHPHGINATGRWVGLSYDGNIVTGWSSMARTEDPEPNPNLGPHMVHARPEPSVSSGQPGRIVPQASRCSGGLRPTWRALIRMRSARQPVIDLAVPG